MKVEISKRKLVVTIGGNMYEEEILSNIPYEKKTHMEWVQIAINNIVFRIKTVPGC